MKFNVQIECDNAAFEDSGMEQEVSRILRDLAAVLPRITGDHCGSLFDHNGNKVGSWQFD